MGVIVSLRERYAEIEKERAKATDKANQMAAEEEEREQRLAKLREQRIENLTKSKDIVAKMNQRVNDLGKSEGEIALDRLRALGNNDLQVEQFGWMLDQIAEFERIEKVTDMFDDLQTKVDAVGKSEAQLTIEKLRGLGATDEQIKKAEQLLAAYEKLSAVDAKRTADAKEITGIMDSLAMSFDALGKSEAELTAAKLKSLGATDAQIEKAKGLMEATERATRAQQLVADVQSPQERFAERIDELNNLFDSLDISGETFDKARSKALQQLLGLDADPASRFDDTIKELTGLLDAGDITKAEFDRARLAAVKERDSVTGNDRVERAAALDVRSAEFQRQRFEPLIKQGVEEKQLAEHKRMVELLARVDAKLESKPPVAIPAA